MSVLALLAFSEACPVACSAVEACPSAGALAWLGEHLADFEQQVQPVLYQHCCLLFRQQL
ncbi:hypothetical protein ACTQ4M_01705 [Lactobacillus amylovorus]|uniref:hypothetical protein n=1 Tax=Lactobacillus amylovorus TaxID=1604 RepID=UPI00232CF6E1|nr:hypothetical protein [Lactobacillus amylovorus]MDB6266309.1 hypothetical protein [Lactobacillus amylovorus]